MQFSYDEKKYPFLGTCKYLCSRTKNRWFECSKSAICPLIDVFRAIDLILQYSEDKKLGQFKLKLHFD
jgi:hypothetical protein